MALGIVPGSEIHTPVAGVRIDGEPQRQAALAQGRVGAAIGQGVGDLAYDVGMKFQANRNARTVFDADLAMRKTAEDFRTNLAKNPDEETWVPSWKDQVGTVRENILSGPNVGPEVKRMLTMKLDAWGQATTSEITQAAQLKSLKETHTSAVAASTMAYSQGDMEGGDNILRAAQSHYAMDESEVKTRMAQGQSTAAVAMADTVVATNPLKAPELIEKFKDKIPPRTYIGVIAHANEAKNRAQAANVNDLAMMMDESPDGTIDPALIKQKTKDGEITQRAADGLMRRMQRKTIETSQSEFIIGSGEVFDHDFTQDKKPEDTARQYKDLYSGLPTPLRIRLYKQIDRQMADAQKQGAKEQRPVEREIFDQMREDRNVNGFTIPMALQTKKGDISFWNTIKSISLGGAVVRDPDKESKVAVTDSLSDLRNADKITPEQIESTYGKGVTREHLIRAEQLHYATIQGKMREWFADPANKNATYEQANDYRIELEKPYVMGAVSQTLKTKSQFGTTKEVQAAYHAGTLTREQAAKILREQFQLK